MSDANRHLGARLIQIQENIQQRIASDLHDSTCQYLIAASLGIMRVRSALGDPAAAERMCDDIDRSIDQALKEMRAFAYLLHPRSLNADGLKVSIEQYAQGFVARTALTVRTSISSELDKLPCQSQHSLLRIVQEALTNVFRHARATEVDISCKVAGDHCVLRISDNGRGMTASEVKDGSAVLLGVGIPAMKARLEQMGGKLEIRSAPEKGRSGTTLRAIIPLPSRAARNRRTNASEGGATTEIIGHPPNIRRRAIRATTSATK